MSQNWNTMKAVRITIAKMSDGDILSLIAQPRPPRAKPAGSPLLIVINERIGINPSQHFIFPQGGGALRSGLKAFLNHHGAAA
jgi:hypothetical protein